MDLHNRKIIVLGAEGMLGQMCVNFFSRNYEVLPITKRFEISTKQAFVEDINQWEDAVVINAIGRIKQKSEDDHELLWVNAILPLELSNSLKENIILIQPSTDCVFDGLKAEPYNIEDTPDAHDTYGWSKRLGEVGLMARPNTFIFRVSIIGPDKRSSKGLLGWFLSNKEGAELKGFTNHLWNGITTLEWCKQVEQWLVNKEERDTVCSLLHGGTRESYSKFEMLNLFQKKWNTRFNISPFETEVGIDRRLVANIVSPSLEEQMDELIAFERNR